jgi:hypothetical protein
MSVQGVVKFYYGKTVPARSVSIAQIKVPVLTPAQLTDANNVTNSEGLFNNQGPLSVWKSSSSLSGPADFTAAALGETIAISGNDLYYVGNQFFELTSILASDGVTPLFYKHLMSSYGGSAIQILDIKGNTIQANSLLEQVGSNSYILYHSLDGDPYRIQYVDANGYPVLQVLSYAHAVAQIPALPVTAGDQYALTGAALNLNDSGTYYLRFTQYNGYQVMPMYTYLPNIPWFPRIRFGLNQAPIDWAEQLFIPSAPYLPSSFIAGTVLDSHMIQFERTGIYVDPYHFPDILVFDQNNNFKYALDGSIAGGASDPPYLKGYVYNWQRNQISSMDPAYARVDVTVDLDTTDIVWGFYTYTEPDVVYTGFDCNPFTNAAAKNSILGLYTKFPGTSPTRNIYHQLFDATGNPISGQTNDPDPPTWSNLVPSVQSPQAVLFSAVAVGASISESLFSFTDARVRGGGLAEQYWDTVPQAVNFWDIGFFDGRPYPFAGALAVYLPIDILNVLSRTEIQDRVNSMIPMGSLAILRFIDNLGNETL